MILDAPVVDFHQASSTQPRMHEFRKRPESCAGKTLATHKGIIHPHPLNIDTPNKHKDNELRRYLLVSWVEVVVIWERQHICHVGRCAHYPSKPRPRNPSHHEIGNYNGSTVLTMNN